MHVKPSCFVIFKGFLTAMSSLMPGESSMQTRSSHIPYIRKVFHPVNSIKYSKLMAVN